uniref:Uncharacterized protein n=1 Tax=Romanomermis culicivorax TaxID=13658 RepID=A0A915KG36_ROMCU
MSPCRWEDEAGHYDGGGNNTGTRRRRREGQTAQVGLGINGGDDGECQKPIRIAGNCRGGCDFPGHRGRYDSHGVTGIVMAMEANGTRLARIAAVVGGIALASR